MARPKRNLEVNLREDIKTVAWQEIAEKGIEALSLRAVARRLNITAPAIYNYYRRKEDLTAALFIDAQNEFSDSQFAAIADLPADNYTERLLALGTAYREWAINNPQKYMLIFRKHNIKRDTKFTDDVGQRWAQASLHGMIPQLSVLEDARKKRILIGEDKIRVPSSILDPWKALQQMYPPLSEFSAYTYYLFLILWSRDHGLIMLELSKRLVFITEVPGELYQEAQLFSLQSLFKQ